MSDLSDEEIQSLMGDDAAPPDLKDPKKDRTPAPDTDASLPASDDTSASDLDMLDALVAGTNGDANGNNNKQKMSRAAFAPLTGKEDGGGDITNMRLLMDVPMQISVELGRASRTVKEILALNVGSVVELDKLSGEPVDLLVNGRIIAKAEVVIIDENFGIRITEIIQAQDRLVLE